MDIVGTKEASRLSGLNIRHISMLCRTGKIPAIKIGHDWLINVENIPKRQRAPKTHKGLPEVEYNA